jgi:RNA polymerase sigma-70 factor, ECF subfamily
MGEDEDVALVHRAQAGDHRAFGKLAMAYERVLFNLALRMVKNREDARDLTQAVFLKAYRGLSGFDDRYRFYSWLYRIMLNECLNHLSAHRVHEPLSEQIAHEQSTPAEQYQAHKISRVVQDALMELTVEHRQVIVLRHFLQLSYREVSEVLNLPEKTVKSRLHAGRQSLRAVLARQGVTSS